MKDLFPIAWLIIAMVPYAVADAKPVAPQAKPAVVSADWHKIDLPADGYTFSVPKSWRSDESGPTVKTGPDPRKEAAWDDDLASTRVIVKVRKSAKITAAKLMDREMSLRKRVFVNTKITTRGPALLGGLPAVRVTGSCNQALGQKGQLKFMQYTCWRNGKAYTFEAISPARPFDTTYGPIFEAIVKSFAFKP